MNYNEHRAELVELAHRYMVYLFACADPDDVATLENELLRLKNEIAHIDAMTEFERLKERETVEWTVESRIKFIM